MPIRPVMPGRHKTAALARRSSTGEQRFSKVTWAIALKTPRKQLDFLACSPKCFLAVVMWAGKLLKRLEPTIGLEPMTCRLRIVLGQIAPTNHVSFQRCFVM